MSEWVRMDEFLGDMLALTRIAKVAAKALRAPDQYDTELVAACLDNALEDLRKKAEESA